MRLNVVTKDQTLKICEWRNQDISMYRTPFFLTEEMQLDFYNNTICNRNSAHRYYSVMDETNFIGMVGLTNISFENSNAELSMVLDPNLRRKGYGKRALLLLLEEGFNNVNLDNIYGECYMCSPSLFFWKAMGLRSGSKQVTLPNRKFYKGKYFDSMYFNFNRSVLNE